MISIKKNLNYNKSIPYHPHYELLNKHLDFEGKNVLEIGCGKGELTRFIAEVAGAKFVYGTDYDIEQWGIEAAEGDNWTISTADARNLCYEDNSFDICFSIGVFEHINGLDKALNEIERVLKPGGKCFAYFEPIWTSIIGHHFNFWIPEDLYLIPPWGHLFMTPDEMYEHINKYRNVSFSKSAVGWIYESDVISRNTRKDYYMYLSQCGMTCVFLSELFRTHREYKTMNEFYSLDEKNREKLLNRFSKEDLQINGFEVVLQKKLW